jgi:spoIIIJ-associated protein
VTDDQSRSETEPAPSRPASSADTGAVASRFLLGLAEAFGVGADTEVVDLGEGDLEVRLHGDELGLLIGPRGQTLQAVQDLTRVAVQRQDEDRHGRLRIDIAGYRERRREALGRFTEQVVAQVVASGQPRALEPMTSADRKVVHDVASSMAGVTTRSEGEEPFRRVVIQPVDA